MSPLSTFDGRVDDYLESNIARYRLGINLAKNRMLS